MYEHYEQQDLYNRIQSVTSKSIDSQKIREYIKQNLISGFKIKNIIQAFENKIEILFINPDGDDVKIYFQYNPSIAIEQPSRFSSEQLSIISDYEFLKYKILRYMDLHDKQQFVGINVEKGFFYDTYICIFKNKYSEVLSYVPMS